MIKLGALFLMQLFILAFLSVTANLAFAEDYPKYQGVYVKLRNGSFVPIQSIELRHARFGDQGFPIYASDGQGLEITRVFIFDEYSRFPMIDAQNAVSIVVNSRSNESIFLDPLVAPYDRYASYGAIKIDPTALALPGRFSYNDKIDAYGYGFFLVANRCGINENGFRIANVSEFITEYEIVGRLKESTSSFDQCGKGGAQIPIFGFNIELGKKIYPFMVRDVEAELGGD